ncbi:hypothetical protein PFISCL1PPCAC_23048, partial [Pristionchus fissidentatus]
LAVLLVLLALCLQEVEGLRGALFRTGRSGGGSATAYPYQYSRSDPLYSAYFNRLARRFHEQSMF